MPDSFPAIEELYKTARLSWTQAFTRIAELFKFFDPAMQEQEAKASAQEVLLKWRGEVEPGKPIVPTTVQPPEVSGAGVIVKPTIAREPIAKPKVPKTPLLTVPAEYRTQYPRAQTPWEPGAFEQSYPDVAWRRSYSLPAYGRNPFQEWLNTQSGPAFASYWANQFRSPLETPVDFDPLAQQNRGMEALAALRGMKGVEDPEQQYWMSRLQATPGEGGGAGRMGLFNLMTAALGKQGGIGYASPIARAKAARMEPLYAKWEQETRAGETGPTLLDYLLQEILGV